MSDSGANGRRVTDSELREVQLRAFDTFQRWCHEQGLRYFTAYGTLLGTVRHGGYIPWDDDIDIMMPREDYELLRTRTRIENLQVGGAVGEQGYPYANVKLCDVRTVVVGDGFYEAGLGVGIDVFPIDGVPTGVPRLLQRTSISILILMLSLQTLEWRQGRNLLRTLVVGILSPTARLISRVFMLRLLSKIAQLYPSADRRGVLVGSFQWSVEPELLGDGNQMIFEGRAVPVPASPSGVLAVLYGEDFMAPPPPESRKTHHTFTAYWR